MSEEISKIISELENYESALFAASKEYREFVLDAAHKRATYDCEYAQAILTISTKCDADKVKMLASERDALAVKQVQNSLKACRIAEALADGSKRHLGVLQSLLSSVQTRSSLLRTERSLVSQYA